MRCTRADVFGVREKERGGLKVQIWPAVRTYNIPASPFVPVHPFHELLVPLITFLSQILTGGSSHWLSSTQKSLCPRPELSKEKTPTATPSCPCSYFYLFIKLRSPWKWEIYSLKRALKESAFPSKEKSRRHIFS